MQRAVDWLRLDSWQLCAPTRSAAPLHALLTRTADCQPVRDCPGPGVVARSNQTWSSELSSAHAKTFGAANFISCARTLNSATFLTKFASRPPLPP